MGKKGWKRMDNNEILLLQRNLKRYRVKNGYTQPEVAEVLNVCSATVKNWEKNPHKVSLDKLLKLSELYHCKITDFFIR